MIKYILIFSLSFPVYSQEWTKENTAWETAFIATHLIDWGQTLDIIESPKFQESNPFLGRNPTRGEVNRYFILMGVSHYLISRHLTEYRSVWQKTTFFYELNVINRNAKIGIKINF